MLLWLSFLALIYYSINNVYTTILYQQDIIRGQRYFESSNNAEYSNNEIPYFKTFAESGSLAQFHRQFKKYGKLRKKTAFGEYLARSIFPSADTGTMPTLAERIMDDLDLRVNPCDNFYLFACGGYVQRSNASSFGAINAFQQAGNRIPEIVIAELQQEVLLNDPKPLIKAKVIYKSCMDEYSIEQRGLSPALQFLSDRGGWPVLGSWNSKGFKFIELLAETRPLISPGAIRFTPPGPIIGVLIQRDFRKKGKYAIYLDQPDFGQFSFGLPNNEVYLLGKNVIYNKAYIEYLTDIAIAFGADPIVAKRDMRDVYEFEAEMAKGALLEEERRLVDVRYNKITIFELSLRYPTIDWLRFLRLVLANAGINVDVNSNVILWASPYYDRLIRILAQTSKRTLANYILFRAIQPLIPALNEHIQYITLRYIATVNGATEPRLANRADFCFQIVNSQFSLVTSRILIEKESKDNKISITRQYSEIIRSILQMRILQANWVSDRTKMLAIKKLNSLDDNIGFPNEILDDKFLVKYYQDFHIGDRFFENLEEVRRENYKIALENLVFPPNNEWILLATVVNAIHSYGTASIEIPSGILGEPFYSNEYPPSMNFGGIGFLIAHEFMHGYDVIGIRFNGNGLIDPYWSDKSVTGFTERANCLVNQFSRYFIPEADLLITNGDKTLNENIADLEGVVTAYYAYKNRQFNSKEHDFVKGLPFNGDQLFFINYARVWCTKTSPIFLRKFPYLDDHAINVLRVIGPLQNMPEFSSAFQCPKNSLMNPNKKCRFWN